MRYAIPPHEKETAHGGDNFEKYYNNLLFCNCKRKIFKLYNEYNIYILYIYMAVKYN